MELGVYAHPWDLRELSEREELGRLSELGFAEVALPTAYHAGRWLTPWSSRGMVRFLEDGTVHLMPEGDYGALKPEPSAEARAATGLPDLIAASRAAGLRTSAWTVLFHNTRLGTVHRHHCVRNAFGDSYTYALCPAREEVLGYGLTLIADVAALGFEAVELEAFGWMGHKHGSHHDKSSFSHEPVTDFLLSYCFCDACRTGLDARDTDPEEAAGKTRDLLRQRLTEGDSMAPPEAPDDVRGELEGLLGEPVLSALLAHRRSVLRDNLRAARDAVPSGTRLTAHVKPDPLFTGSQMGLALEDVGDLLDEVVLTHYGEGPERIASAYAGVDRLPCPARLCLHPKAPELRGDEDLLRLRALAGRLNLAGLRVYHLGLLPWRTVERAARVLGDQN